MQLAEPRIKAKELNALWHRQFETLEGIRKDALEYGAKMKLNGYHHNPFWGVALKYENAMRELRDQLVHVCISYYKDAYAPNVEISHEDLVRKMTDTLTDELSPTDSFGIPIIFDAEWLVAYIQNAYLDFADEVAERQIRTRLYHYCYPVSNGMKENLVQNDKTIVIPFHGDTHYSGGYCVVDEKTKEAIYDLDKLIQIRCMEADAAEIQPSLFTSESLKWNVILQKPEEIFTGFKVEGKNNPVLHFRIYRDRQEMEVAFKDAADASMIASVLSHHPAK